MKQLVRIGRNTGNNVVVNDVLVSSIHCQITLEDDGTYRIMDLNSTNGTYVNGVKIVGEVVLYPSDEVRVGNTTLSWQQYFAGAGDTVRGGGFAGGGGQPFGGNAGGGGYAGGGQPAAAPSNYLVWAILVTIFCCIPFGIVAIVNSSKVDSLYASGRYAEALEASRKTKTWLWWAFGTGLAVYLIYFIFWVVVGVGMGVSGYY